MAEYGTGILGVYSLESRVIIVDIIMQHHDVSTGLKKNIGKSPIYHFCSKLHMDIVI